MISLHAIILFSNLEYLLFGILQATLGPGGPALTPKFWPATSYGCFGPRVGPKARSGPNSKSLARNIPKYKYHFYSYYYEIFLMCHTKLNDYYHNRLDNHRNFSAIILKYQLKIGFFLNYPE